MLFIFSGYVIYQRRLNHIDLFVHHSIDYLKYERIIDTVSTFIYSYKKWDIRYNFKKSFEKSLDIKVILQNEIIKQNDLNKIDEINILLKDKVLNLLEYDNLSDTFVYNGKSEDEIKFINHFMNKLCNYGSEFIKNIRNEKLFVDLEKNNRLEKQLLKELRLELQSLVIAMENNKDIDLNQINQIRTKYQNIRYSNDVINCINELDNVF